MCVLCVWCFVEEVDRSVESELFVVCVLVFMYEFVMVCMCVSLSFLKYVPSLSPFTFH